MDILFETFPKAAHIDARLTQLGANWQIGLRGEVDQAAGDDAILRVWADYPAQPSAPPRVTLLATVNPHFAIFVPA